MGNMEPRILASHFETQLRQVDDWVTRQTNMSMLDVPYTEAVGDPGAVAATVAAFLDGSMDVAKMAGTVDPELYRQRVAGAPR